MRKPGFETREARGASVFAVSGELVGGTPEIQAHARASARGVFFFFFLSIRSPPLFLQDLLLGKCVCEQIIKHRMNLSGS